MPHQSKKKNIYQTLEDQFRHGVYFQLLDF